MKCLITNVGNRNIVYKGNTYSNVGESQTFLEWSQNLLQNYDQKKIDLDLNIINPLVDRQEYIFDKIILLYSDQSTFNTRTTQDTLYEADIIKKLLIDKYGYKHDEVDCVRTKCKVTDNGQLMKEYRSFLLEIKKQRYNKVILCDAGGTAQQKMALKIMAEFILPKAGYEVKYVEDNKIISDVTIDEYRSVISHEQAIQLITHGHFEAAGDILGIHLNDPKSVRDKIFISLMHWFNGNRSASKNILQPLQKNIRSQLLKDLLNNVVYSENTDLLELFESKYIILVDKFYKTLFYISVKRYSDAILNFAYFYEYFLELQLNYFSPEFELGTREFETIDQKSNLQNLISTWYPELNTHNASSKSLGSQILLGKNIDNKTVKSICRILSPHIDHTDDVIVEKRVTYLRNKIAHEGMYVSEKKFYKDYNYVPKLIQEIRNVLMLNRKNLFQEVCELMEQNLRT